MAARKYIFSIEELEEDEELGEKVNQLIKLKKAEFLIPESLVIKAQAYFDFLKGNNIEKKIKHLLGTVDLTKAKSVKDTALHINKHLTGSDIPGEIIREIKNAYKKMGNVLEHAHVNVFFSHSLKDYPSHDLKGDASLLDKIKENWTRAYSPSSPKLNPTLIIQKVLNGKKGKIKTSTKQIRTSLNLSKKDIDNLENLVKKFKKEFYMPYEIDWVIDKDKVYILKIRPETSLGDNKSIFPETHYQIFKNSHNLL